MSNKVPLKIITPKGIFWDKEVDIVTVRTTEGNIGLQKNKSPFIASLDISEMHINSENSSDYKKCAIAGGLVLANKTHIDIITDAIEFSEKIDISRAERDRKTAENLIKVAKTEAEHQKAQIALKKAMNRIGVKKS